MEDLVERAMKGRIRIPEFQRGLKWEQVDVIKLFDSIYRGYPIGTLLMWVRPAPDDLNLKLGPLSLSVPGRERAWWVVDGQQRLVALTAGLCFPSGRDRLPGERYAVDYDIDADAFVGVSEEASGEHRVPLPELLDATQLGMWLHERELGPERVRQVYEVGKRLREYQVPLYLVETDQEEDVREIFYRTNTGGRPLKQAEVFDALVGYGDVQPQRIEDIAEALGGVGMGEVDRHKILQAALAILGLDVTRRFDDQRVDARERLGDVVPQTLKALRAVLSFLNQDAGVPHLRVLPFTSPLLVLAKFFHHHPRPNARSRTLLRRWLWRGMLTRAHDSREVTRLRRSVKCIVEDDEEASVQNLLKHVPGRALHEAWPVEQNFDARSADSRLVMLALSTLRPRAVSGVELDLRKAFEVHDAAVFAPVSSRRDVPGSRSPANRMLHPPIERVRLKLKALARNDLNDPVLRSHAISPDSARALLEDAYEVFFQTRRSTLHELLQEVGKRFARWGENDRPSIDYILSRGIA